MSDPIDQELAERIRQLSRELAPQPTDLSPRPAELQGIRSVLFDVYGTLFVSGSGDIGVAQKSQSGEAMAAALSAAGFHCRSPGTGGRGAALLVETIAATHRELRAQGIEFPEIEIRTAWGHVIAALKDESLVEVDLKPGMIEQVAVEYECRVNPTWPMPDLADALRQLCARGILLGIVSNAQFYTRLMFLAHLGALPEQYGFDPYACSYSFEMWQAKPSLALFQKALGHLGTQAGVRPSQTLYVGNDVLNDIRPARQLGMRTALFAGDRRSLRLREGDDRCRDAKPDAVVTSLSQIIGLLR